MEDLRRDQTGDRGDADAERHCAHRTAQAVSAMLRFCFLLYNNDHPFNKKLRQQKIETANHLKFTLPPDVKIIFPIKNVPAKGMQGREFLGCRVHPVLLFAEQTDSLGVIGMKFRTYFDFISCSIPRNCEAEIRKL